MFERIEIQNFKSLRSVTVDLCPLTVIVGPNGTGKTSVLESFEWLGRLARRTASRSVFSQGEPVFTVDQLSDVCTKSSNSGIVLSASGSFERSQANVAFSAEASAQPQWNYALSLKSAGPSQLQQEKGIINQAGVHPQTAPLGMTEPIWDWIRLQAMLRFEPRRLAEPCQSEHEIPRIEEDGFGLAPTLAHLKLMSLPQFESLVRAVQQVLPQVTDFHLDRVKVKMRTGNQEWGNRLVMDLKGAPGVKAQYLSDGTLIVLGLLTLLHSPSTPRMVLWDDIERGLHPGAVGLLIEQVRTVLKKNPNLQIIATSHSPYLVDHLKPEEVRLMTLREDGTSSCAALTDHPEFEKWRDVMRPGEFWSSFGEDWAKSAKPSAAEI